MSSESPSYSAKRFADRASKAALNIDAGRILLAEFPELTFTPALHLYWAWTDIIPLSEALDGAKESFGLSEQKQTELVTGMERIEAAIRGTAPLTPPGGGELPSHKELEVLARYLEAVLHRLRRRQQKRERPYFVTKKEVIYWAAFLVFAAIIFAAVKIYLQEPMRWQVSFYKDLEMEEQKLLKKENRENIWFRWDNEAPTDGVPADGFSLRAKSCLTLSSAATLNLTLGSDDGSRLLINDQLLIDLWGFHAYTEKEGRIELAPGTHSIVVEYFEHTGGAMLQLKGNIKNKPASARFAPAGLTLPREDGSCAG